MLKSSTSLSIELCRLRRGTLHGMIKEEQGELVVCRVIRGDVEGNEVGDLARRERGKMAGSGMQRTNHGL